MVYQNTEDAALYNKKHPFSLKRKKASNLFLIANFIMVKWIDACQVSQEVCLLTQRAFHWRPGTLNPACVLHTGSPSPQDIHGLWTSVAGNNSLLLQCLNGYQDLE